MSENKAINRRPNGALHLVGAALAGLILTAAVWTALGAFVYSGAMEEKTGGIILFLCPVVSSAFSMYINMRKQKKGVLKQGVLLWLSIVLLYLFCGILAEGMGEFSKKLSSMPLRCAIGVLLGSLLQMKKSNTFFRHTKIHTAKSGRKSRFT